jgi:hypothetical protein
MEALVISRNTLPEPILPYIRTERIKVSPKNGRVVLSPVVEKNGGRKMRKIDKLIEEMQSLCSDGRLSSEDFIRDKAVEKALEEN